jgi:hypothetical protein
VFEHTVKLDFDARVREGIKADSGRLLEEEMIERT